MPIRLLAFVNVGRAKRAGARAGRALGRRLWVWGCRVCIRKKIIHLKDPIVPKLNSARSRSRAKLHSMISFEHRYEWLAGQRALRLH